MRLIKVITVMTLLSCSATDPSEVSLEQPLIALDSCVQRTTDCTLTGQVSSSTLLEEGTEAVTLGPSASMTTRMLQPDGKNHLRYVAIGLRLRAKEGESTEKKGIQLTVGDSPSVTVQGSLSPSSFQRIELDMRYLQPKADSKVTVRSINSTIDIAYLIGRWDPVK